MNQVQGYGPQYPQGYPPPGHPPPKKGMGGGKIALLVFGGLFGGCVVLGAIGSAANDKNGATEGAGQPIAKLAPAANAFPWVSGVQQNCAAYKSAPNEIKKSAIFRANQELLQTVTVQSARGELSRLRTNQGGSELSLGVKAGNVEFATPSISSAIKQGSPIYEAASELKVGDCVTFSVTKVRSSSMVERSQVCDLEYFAEFTALASCK